MEKLLYRDTEAAELTGLGRSTIWKAMKDGELRSVKIGAARRIPADALLEFVQSFNEQAH